MKHPKDIRTYNDNGLRHGYWEVYYCEHNCFNIQLFGTLWYKATYHNGKRVGYDEIVRQNRDIMKRYNIT